MFHSEIFKEINKGSNQPLLNIKGMWVVMPAVPLRPLLLCQHAFFRN